MADEIKKEIPVAEPSESEGFTSSPPQGLSNTPVSWYFNKKPEGKVKFNVCIDYLKVTFYGEFFPEKHSINEWRGLLEAFLVDPGVFKPRPGLNGYKRGYYFDEHLLISAGGAFTKSGEVDTLSIEMKGQACRDFEKTARRKLPKTATPEEIDKTTREAWKRLLRAIADYDGKCTRIDLPIDDLVGYVDFEILKEKVKTRCYKSSLRNKDTDEDQSKTDGTVPVHVRTSKNKGYTISIGGRNTRQLCIYNKKAQMESEKGGSVLTDNWIRYECRYYHGSAEKALALLTDAFEDEDPHAVSKFIVGCLKGMLDVKEYLSDQIRHAPTWSVWKSFLAEVEAVEIISQARVESTIQTNALWLTKDAAKAVARLVNVYPHNMLDIVFSLIKEGMSRYDNKDLFKINNQRKEDGDEPFLDLKEAKEFFLTEFGNIPEIDPRIVELMNREQVRMGSVRYYKRLFSKVEEAKKPDGDGDNDALDADCSNPPMPAKKPKKDGE